jgi:K+-sensing histidine kinase KdpD
MALVWWSVLLHEKNKEIFDFKVELLQLQEIRNGNATLDLEHIPAYSDIKNKFERQNLMILGESMVFGLILILGMWFIQKAFNREIEANNKVKNFLMSITHELKSPIASINLVLDTFVKRELPHSTIKELSTDALNESHRLEKLINNILLSIKLNEAYQYNFEPTSVTDMIKQVVNKNTLNSSNIPISIILNHQNDIINVDAEAFFSVINNLVENALKYGNDKPVIVETTEDDKFFYTLVKDNGNGISDNLKKEVFEQFYRIGNESVRKTKGTGLGLYIVKKIVLAHKGNITIENNKPSGSVFKISIPKYIVT